MPVNSIYIWGENSRPKSKARDGGNGRLLAVAFSSLDEIFFFLAADFPDLNFLPIFFINMNFGCNSITASYIQP
jgi:hypothetical protein